MLARSILAAALALGLSSLVPAQAQTATVIPTCGVGVNSPLGPGGNLFTDSTGTLCTSGSGGGSTGSVPAASSTIAGPTPTTSTTSTLVGKASAANLYGFSFTQGTTAGFFAILNAATAPAGGAAIAPIECVAVPVGGYVARRQVIPDRYPAGVVFVSTSSCSTFTAVVPVLMTSVVQ